MRLRYIAALALLLAAPSAAQVTQPPPAPSAGGYTAPAPAIVANSWYPPIGYTLSATAALSTGTIRFMPFAAYKGGTISGLGVFVASNPNSGSVQLSIYANSGTTNLPTGPALGGCPITLTTSTGTYSCSISAGTGTNPVLVQGAVYWLAVETDTAATGVTMTGGNASTSSGYAGLVGAPTLVNVISSNTLGSAATYAHTFSAGSYQDMTGLNASRAFAVHPLVIMQISAP